MSHLLKRIETLFYFIKLFKQPKTLMENDFKKIEDAGKNSVEALMQWLTDAKIIDQAQETHEKVEKMFSEVADKSHVEFDKFQEVLEKIATEKQEDVENMSQKLTAALQAGVQAFAASLEEKTKK